MGLPFADDCNFWKTGGSGPDKWIERCKKLIMDVGGDYIIESFGSDSRSGRAAYMMAFQIDEEKFKSSFAFISKCLKINRLTIPPIINDPVSPINIFFFLDIFCFNNPNNPPDKLTPIMPRLQYPIL